MFSEYLIILLVVYQGLIFSCLLSTRISAITIHWLLDLQTYCYLLLEFVLNQADK